MTEDLDDLMCQHSAAGRPERFPAKACVLAGECGCVYGAEWSRALRLADDAAEVAILHGRQYLGCELNEEYRGLQDARVRGATAARKLALAHTSLFDTVPNSTAPDQEQA